MTFQELQNIELGTKLHLKDTNAYFRVASIDLDDNEVPLCVSLIETDKPLFVSYDSNWEQEEIIEVDANDKYYEPEYWIFANKTVMREEAELTRSQFEKMTKDYYIITMRDLEIVEEVEDSEASDLCNDFRNQHNSSPSKTFADEVAEKFSEVSGVLPIAATRQFVNDFNSRKVTIQIINAAIARAAQAGKHIIRLDDEVNHQVSEEIKDLYRQAGYHVAFETIQW